MKNLLLNKPLYIAIVMTFVTMIMAISGSFLLIKYLPEIQMLPLYTNLDTLGVKYSILNIMVDSIIIYVLTNAILVKQSYNDYYLFSDYLFKLTCIISCFIFLSNFIVVNLL